MDYSIAREIARRYLYKRCSSPDELEDIVQDTMVKLNMASDSFEFRSEREFEGYVRRVALNAWHDAYRKADKSDPVDDGVLAETESGEFSPEDELLLAECREIMEDIADEAFLGKKRVDLAEQITAVQMNISEKPQHEILEWINEKRHGEKVTQEQFEEWKAEECVLRFIAYSAQYLTSPVLTRYVLGRGSRHQGDPTEIFEQSRDESTNNPPEGWQWTEVKAIVWRYCYEALPHRVAEILQSETSAQKLESLFAECEQHFPFAKFCRELGLEAGLNESFILVLKTDHVWKRLAFEYRYRDLVRVNDIWARLKDAGEFCDSKMSPTGVKQGWLDNHRLLDQFKKFAMTSGYL